MIMNASLSEVEKGLSTQFFYVLTMLCRDKPLDILYSSGSGEGLVAYKTLHNEFCPTITSGYVGLLIQLLSFKFNSPDVVAAISLFERCVREYESQSGKTLGDDLKIGILICVLKIFQLRNIRSDIPVGWTLGRGCGTRSTTLPELRSILQRVHDPWMLVPNKGKGLKGSQKNKGKDKGDSKGKGNQAKSEQKGDKDKSKMECFYCNKMGHSKADCRKRQADLKKAEKPAGGTAASASGQKDKPTGAVLSEREDERF